MNLFLPTKPKKGAAKSKARRLQKKMYQALKAETEIILGATPSFLLEYERSYSKDFKLPLKNWRICPRETFLGAIRSSEVTLIGDFHPFDQAQKTVLRIARELLESSSQKRSSEDSYKSHLLHPNSLEIKNQGNSVPELISVPDHYQALHSEMDQPIALTLGLEMISSEHQHVLDQFQAGQIDTEEFHRQIAYETNWGFPWENYRPLFEWAQVSGVRLIALNRPKELRTDNPKKDLADRDRWAAGIITDLFLDSATSFAHSPAPSSDKKSPSLVIDKKLLVLYGEYHLGRSHLPAQIEKISSTALGHPLKTVTIHQNLEKLYWKLIDHTEKPADSVIELRENVFCVFSAPPWTKLQSLVNWAENNTSSPVEEEADTLFLMHSFGEKLAEFFTISCPTFENVSTVSIRQTGNLTRKHLKKYYNKAQSDLIEFHMRTNHSLYLRAMEVAFLGAPTHNRAAEMAAMHLLHNTPQAGNLFKSDSLFELTAEGICRSLLETAFSYLCTLILNPHRKCDLPKTHQTRLEGLSAREKTLFEGEREARHLTLRFFSTINGSLDQNPRVVEKFSFKGFLLPEVLERNLEKALEQFYSLHFETSVQHPLSREEENPTIRTHPPHHTVMMACRYIGKILGHYLHEKLLKENFTISELKAIFLRPTSTEAQGEKSKEAFLRLIEVLTILSRKP